MPSGIGVRFASQPRATVAIGAAGRRIASLPVPSQNAAGTGRWSLSHVAEPGRFFTKTSKGIPFDLTHSLAAQLEFVGHLFERARPPVVQTEAE